ncbi:uncharacterized protein [Aristolochia californica]|uniref:uncharacterized protein n=1 Tax=Aristolochia californica TaxID=171875 RepID=UPI0035D8B52F
MADKVTIVICHYGGEFHTSDVGSMQYKGGGAKALDVRSSTTLEEIKSELALELQCETSALKLKYFLPGDNITPLNIVIDKDIQRMIDFHGDVKTVHVYVLHDEIVDHDASLVIDNRANKAVVGDSTSTAGPTSAPRSTYRVKKLTASTPSGINSVPLLSSSWDKAIIGVGQEFKSVKEFRSSLGKFAIAGGFHFHFVKNDSRRVTAKCKNDNCSWRIHASRLPKTPLFKIKKYEGSHTCGGGGGGSNRHAQATKHWVADVIKEKMISSPKCTPRDIINDLQRDYGVELRYHQAWRGMELAREALQGSPLKEYDSLPRFCRLVTETNPGNHIVLNTTDESRFKGLFVCFYACRFGFDEGCRPVIFLSGTSLKNRHQETLLSATSIDADNEMFPVAFGIVDTENEANWVWFLNELKQVVKSDRCLTFISNRHEEVIKAVPKVFQDSYHAFCMNHVCHCFKLEVRGGFSSEVKDYMIGHLWQAAYATNISDFEKEINEIQRISEDAFNWIQQSHPHYWSNAFFQGHRYNHMTSDVSKLFVEWVLDSKDLPLSKMLHQIRCRIMELIYERLASSEKWDTRLAPSAEEYLKNDAFESHTKQVLCSSGDHYEVGDDTVIRVVNMNTWTCTCRQWQIQGRPCPHAIAVLHHVDRSPYDFCSPYLTAEMYRLTYSVPLTPVPEDDYASSDGEQTPLQPPLLKRKPGRPRKKVVEPAVEARSVHCSRCGGTKHNKLTCKEPAENLPPPEPNYISLEVKSV